MEHDPDITARNSVEREKHVRFVPLRKRGTGSRHKHVPHYTEPAPVWQTPEEDLEAIGPREPTRPALTHALGHVKLSQNKQTTKLQPGIFYSPADIELFNFVMAVAGEEELQRFLRNVQREEDHMEGKSMDEKLRILLEEFATPAFPSEAVRNFEKKESTNGGYYVFQTLAKNKLVVQVGRERHPSNGRMLFQYQDTLKVQAAAESESTPRAMPALVPATSEDHPEPKLPVEINTKPKPKAKAPAQRSISAQRTLSKHKASLGERRSTHTERSSDVVLGVLSFSKTDLVAMRHFARMLHEVIDKFAVDDHKTGAA